MKKYTMALMLLLLAACGMAWGQGQIRVEQDIRSPGTPNRFVQTNGSNQVVWGTINLNLFNTLDVAHGGTNAATAGAARTSLGVPALDGTGATGTWGIGVSGNAGTVTNGLYNTGVYNDPTWLTGLNANKLTGTTLPSLDGGALTNLNGSNVATGTVGDARLSGNVALYNATAPVFTNPLIAPLMDKGSQVFNVKAYGAVGDAKEFSDGVATASSPTFTSATAGFVSLDIGKTAYIEKAGATTALTGCSMTALSYTLVCGASSFATTDQGKIITLVGAGAGGTDLVTAVSQYTSGTTVTLQTAAVMTVAATTATMQTFFKTTIAAVGSSTSITLAAAPPTSKTGATFLYGTLDTTALGVARTAANLTGGIVYFPPGKYLIDGFQPLESNVQYRGAGMGNTVIYHAPGLFAGFIVPNTSTTVKNLVADLTIDGSYPLDVHPNPEVDMFQGSDHTVERVEVKNSGAAGVLCYAPNTHVSYCRLIGLGLPLIGGTQGIVASSVTATGNIITNNSVSGYRLSGIYVWGSGHVIKANHVWNNHIQTTPTGGGQIAIGPSLVSGASGMNLIEGNTIGLGGGTATSGIECDGHGTAIIGNTIDSQGINGIAIQAGDYWSVTGNIVKNCGSVGILVKGGDTSTATHFIIANNHVYDDRSGGAKTQTYGIKIASGLTVDDYSITGNDVTGNVNSPGMSLLSTGNNSEVWGNIGNAGGIWNYVAEFQDESNIDQLKITSTTTQYKLQAITTGAAGHREVAVYVGTTDAWDFKTSGAFWPGGNNVFDIGGISGGVSKYIRNIYLQSNLNWGTTNTNPDISIAREAANILKIGSGSSTAAALSVNADDTDASNYSRLKFSANSTGAAIPVHIIGAENAGTGISRGIGFAVGNGVIVWNIRTGGGLEPATSLATDIGSSAKFVRDFFLGRHFVTSGTAPTPTAGTGAGTTPSVTVTGNDQCGLISVTTGTGVPAAANTVVSVAFNVIYALTPKMIQLNPANAAAAALSGVAAGTSQVWVNQPDTTTAAFTVKVGAGGLTDSTAYSWYYEVKQ